VDHVVETVDVVDQMIGGETRHDRLRVGGR
jgi:hypothetical protein